MLKLKEVLKGWEINTSSDFEEILKPKQIQFYSNLKPQLNNQIVTCKAKSIKEIRTARKSKQREISSYFDWKASQEKQKKRQIIYPIQLVSLVQGSSRSININSKELNSDALKPTNSLRKVLRRKSVYLNSILKQVNQYTSQHNHAPSRDSSVMSVNRSTRWFDSLNIQYKHQG